MFPRLIEVPERTGCYILSEELILHYLPLLFGSYRIASKTLARITRSADIDADSVYDEDLNYRDHMAGSRAPAPETLPGAFGTQPKKSGTTLSRSCATS